MAKIENNDCINLGDFNYCNLPIDLRLHTKDYPTGCATNGICVSTICDMYDEESQNIDEETK